MSVIKYTPKEINKLGSSILNQNYIMDYLKYQPHAGLWIAEQKEFSGRDDKELATEYILRMCWYLHVCNETVYALQYQEQPTLDFNFDWSTDVDRQATYKTVIELAEGIRYNLTTNDGNMIVPNGYFDTFLWIIEQSHKQYHYNR